MLFAHLDVYYVYLFRGIGTFEKNRRFIAPVVARLIGVGALTLAGCSKPNQQPRLTGCRSAFMNHEGITDIKGTILDSISMDYFSETGKPIDLNLYDEASAAALNIQNIYVDQYSKHGVIINPDIYDVAEKNPYKNSAFQYCINGATGTITAGNEACILSYPNYRQVVKNNQLGDLKPQCGDLTPSGSK